MTLQKLSTESTTRWIQENRQKWLRIALVLAVLAASIAAPLVVPNNRTLLLIGLVPAVAAVWLIIRWPVLGLLALIVTAILVRSPDDLPGGLNYAVILLILLIGLWVLDMVVYKRIGLVPSRPIRPLLALILVACIAFGVGQLGWFTFAQSAPLDAQIGGLFVFVLSVGAFLVAAHQITNLRWLQVLTFLFIGLGALFVLGWITPLGAVTGGFFQRAATANSMFWTWLVVLTFSQALFNRKLHIGWRLVLGLIVAMTLYVAYFRAGGWKSGYLPAFVAIAAMIGARSWRAGLAIALLSIVPALYLSSQAIVTDEYSFSTRVDAWLIMLEIIKENPILGFGPANYYWYTPFFPIRGYAVQFNSHNQYIDIVAQIGLLGLACFLWFGAEMAWLGLQLRDRVPEGFARAYVYGAIGGLAGTFAAAMLADWVFPFVYNIGLNGMRGSMLAWIFLGGLIAVEQFTLRQSVSDSTAEPRIPIGVSG